MSNDANINETVECNCWQFLDINTINSVHGEVNNNHTSIERTEITNNNTIIIVCVSNFNSNESICDKAVQTTLELGTHQDIADKTADMEKDSNDSNNFPFRSNVNPTNFKSVQTNEDDIVTMEDFRTSYHDMNIRSYHESNVTKGTNRNIDENKSSQLQKLVSDARQVDKIMAPNNSVLDSSQIVKLLNQSERNKAVLKSMLPKFTSNMSTLNKNSQSEVKDSFPEKIPATKSAIKQILDIMRRESPNVEKMEVTKADVLTQTEVVGIDHKNKQTVPEFANVCYSNCTKNMDVNCVMKEFLRESRIYCEEFQQRMHFLFLRYSSQSKDQKEKFCNNNQLLFCDEGANASSYGNNDKVDNASIVHVKDNAGIDSNVSNLAPAGDFGNLATNTNNSHDIGTSSNGGHARNTENNHAGTDANNNDKVFTAVNPMPRHGPALEEEQVPVMQPQGQLTGKSALVRAGRLRGDVSNPRFAPYPRQQFWQQSEFNGRQRQIPHMHEYPNINGVHLQHNSMIRPFNGWQTPNLPNPQSFFTPHHHYHNHF